MTLLERLVSEAIAEGELRPDVDPRQLAYEIESPRPRRGDAVSPAQAGSGLPHARRAVLDRLRALPARHAAGRTEELLPRGIDHVRPRRAGRDPLRRPRPDGHRAQRAVRGARWNGRSPRTGPAAATPSTAGGPTTPDVFHAVREFAITYRAPIRGTGRVAVHFWLDQLGETSAEYGFRVLSLDGAHRARRGPPGDRPARPGDDAPDVVDRRRPRGRRVAAQAGGRKKSRIRAAHSASSTPL